MSANGWMFFFNAGVGIALFIESGRAKTPTARLGCRIGGALFLAGGILALIWA